MPPDVGGRQRDELGERTRVVDADALGPGALHSAAGHAVAAPAADQVAFAADQVADREIRDFLAHRDDLADELVADDERRRRCAPCAQPSHS